MESDSLACFIENAESLTIGQMARLNGVSEKTLRLYHQKGLLEPSETDPNTGYRYYSAAQSRKLSGIARLQNIGFGLQEIKKILDEHEVLNLTCLYEERLEQIEQEMGALSVARGKAESFLSDRCTDASKYKLDTIALEWQPAKRILRFDAIKEPGIDLVSDDAMCRAAKWYYAVGIVKREIARRKLPPILFNNISSIVTAESLADRSLVVSGICVLVDSLIECKYEQVEVIPSGHHLVYYTDKYFEAIETFEGDTIAMMLDYAEANHFKVTGPYIGAGSIDEPERTVHGRAALKFSIPVAME